MGWERRISVQFYVCLTLVLMATALCVSPSAAESECDSCIPCHGNIETVHGDFNHTAVPGNGPVLIFDDYGHDDAAWAFGQPTPHFDVTADCTICHTTDLPAAHGNDCATCHPSPYDTLGIWGKGCQQGGCHSFYHTESTMAHWPFEHDYDCNVCHNGDMSVPQNNCLNCHAKYVSGDASPPVTTSNALAEYVGPAKIGFSIKENGKVGVGRVFYSLDGGTTTAAGKHLFISTPGQHELRFWSKDQSGNTESAPNTIYFNIIEDTTPPTTTSDAKSSYFQGAVINLTATDASTLGVKTTYYRLNDNAIQSGTKVYIPATTGTITYTLDFWSEDWSGNIETQQSVTFTVTSGTGTLRLSWGQSDLYGSPCPGDPEANASWTVRKGKSYGTVVAKGAGACPDWDGVDDVSVQAGSTPYYISIDWWDSYYGYDDNTSYGPVYVTNPGDIILLRY